MERHEPNCSIAIIIENPLIVFELAVSPKNKQVDDGISLLPSTVW